MPHRPQTTTGAVLDDNLNAKTKELQELRFSIGESSLIADLTCFRSGLAAVLPGPVQKADQSAQEAEEGDQTDAANNRADFSFAALNSAPEIAIKHLLFILQ